MTAIQPAVRQVVLIRDNGKCQRCGNPVFLSNYSLQHRRPRGAGGTKDPAVSHPANLITLCGSATTGCHQKVEQFRGIAREDGYAISLHTSLDLIPTIPVNTFEGWMLLDNDGNRTPTEKPT